MKKLNIQIPKMMQIDSSYCGRYANSHHLQFQFNMYELVKAGGGTTEKPDLGINHKNQP